MTESNTESNVVRLIRDLSSTSPGGDGPDHRQVVRIDHETGQTHPHETILRTKLHRPQLGTDLVCRDRLMELMAGTTMTPLTVVSAPAGYGKSVLATQWAERYGQPVAWVSLDERDGDLRGFLAYFLAAVHSVVPESCPVTQQLLQASEIPSVQVVVGHLANELDAAGMPCTVVLDDYHRISRGSPVHECVSHLLEHPPAGLHLVIITRRDPPLTMARFRATGRLTEVRLRDLRFTQQEMQEFLAASAGIEVSENALCNLGSQMEGWAAGLRLIVLALRGVDDAEAFLQQLRGGIQSTQQYLLHEILEQRSPRMRQWLLRTSILDRFCPELCEAMDVADPLPTGQEGLDGRGFVAEAQKGNLFVINLDSRGEWFRYHHLFQKLLSKELQRIARPPEIADLHRRASEWFESRGLLEEALQHALDTGESDDAVLLVGRHRLEVLNADRWYELERWLSRLPEAVIQQRAELLISRAWGLLRRLRIELMLPVLDQVEALLDGDAEPQPVRGELALFRGFVAFFQGDGPLAAELLEQAMEQMPDTYHEPHAEAETIFALTNQMEGRKEQAIRRLGEQLTRLSAAHELRRSRLLAAFVFVHIIAGDLDEAERANQRFRDAVADSPHVHIQAWGEYLQGLVHLYRNELAAAIDFSQRSLAQRFFHHKRALVDTLAALMVAHQASAQPDEAQAALRMLREYTASLDDPAFLGMADSAEARLAIMQARPESAIRWLRSTEPPAAEVMLFWFEIPCLTRCRALIAEGRAASLGEAEEQLRQYVGMLEAHHNTCHLIEALALLAMACARQNEAEEALGALERAVALAAPGRFVLPFVELGPPMADLLQRLDSTSFTQHLLSSFKRPVHRVTTKAPARGRPVPDALTNREIDVLELLALRLHNKEIAASLCISIHTVADHLKRIYQKLDVNSRRQAADRAVALGLIKPNQQLPE